MINLLNLEKSALFRSLFALDQIYTQIEHDEQEWKEKAPATCKEGCGSCCIDFEPDVLEIEALYMAAWLIQNEREKAIAIADETYIWPRFLDYAKGCFLFDPESPYHCTVYEGRALICRLFGYSSDTGKDEKIRWKPCKFIPTNELTKGFEHRQYNEAEMIEKIGSLPPVMSHYLRQALAIQPEDAGKTHPLREILPRSIQKIFTLLKYLEIDTIIDPDDFPTTPSAA